MMPQASESKTVGKLGSLRPRRGATKPAWRVSNGGYLIVEPQHLERHLMDKSHAGGTEFFVSMQARPDAFLFETQFQHHRSVRRGKRLPDLSAFAGAR